jgi:ATP-dependent Clp protease adaptor protein ClpS
MMDVIIRDRDAVAVLEQAKPMLKRPSLYQVVIINDDYTPMEFVVEILQKYFDMGLESAQETMYQIHTQGKAVCAVYPYDIAETKVALVTECARKNEYPLLCDLEACTYDS